MGPKPLLPSPGVLARRGHAALRLACASLATIALVDLAIRAAVRLELRWDTFMYHLPFAAARGGLPIPYEMNDKMALRFQGFPPLPHLLQGLLWRWTGSVNATGVVGFVAYAVFIAWCHFGLRARFGMVALISLTAPMVIIHTTTSYVDLFGNSLLAIGIASLLYLHLCDTQPARLQLLVGLAGLIGAAFSKFQLVAVVAFVFVLYALVCLRADSAIGWSRTRRFLVLLAAALLAASPYLRNLIRYGNPFWPVRIPFLPTLPFSEDEIAQADTAQTPVPLLGHGRLELFVRSLFEWKLPTSYPDRPRWIIDQGNALEAFRMGGFWGVGTAIFLLVFAALLFVKPVGDGEPQFRRKPASAILGAAALLWATALLPQSHDLRYYLFMPLVWAAAIAMLFPRLEQAWPRVASLLLILVIGLFGAMVSENRAHYRIERVGLPEAGREWDAARWWPLLEGGQRYCAVDMVPIGILLTGRTLSEYSITDRDQRERCPPGMIVLSWSRLPAMSAASEEIDRSFQLYQEGSYRRSIAACERALALNPDSAIAYNTECAAYNAIGDWNAGIAACQKALALRPTLQIAKNNLGWAMKMKTELKN